MDTIRTFIAVELPQDTKMAVDKLTTELRDYGSGINWVKAANLHITLRFLGDIDEQLIPNLTEHIKTNIYSFGKFDLSFLGLGGFPNMKTPRVIWAGTETGNDKLRDLATSVELSCIESKLGRGDKRFLPHLTIGRVKNPYGIDKLLRKIESKSFCTEPFEINEIIIFKSDLSPSGPKYTPLETIKL